MHHMGEWGASGSTESSIKIQKYTDFTGTEIFLGFINRTEQGLRAGLSFILFFLTSCTNIWIFDFPGSQFQYIPNCVSTNSPLYTT